MPRVTAGADAAPAALAIHAMPGHYIRRLQQVAVALFARRLEGEVTPVQFAALSAIRHERACDQARIAALIGYDRATIGDVIDRLESRGWVVRAAGTRDRRTKVVTLTPAGRTLLRRAVSPVRRVQDELMAPLSPIERRQFERLCRKLLRAHDGGDGALG